MKIKLILSVFILVYNLIFAQNYQKDVQGTWITVFKEMKDGSTYIPKSCNPFPPKFIFTEDKLCMNKKDDHCFNYTINKGYIETSENSGYKIEKLTSDSLVILQSMIGNEEEDKLERIYLVKEQKILEQQIKSYADEKNIVVNNFFFPNVEKPLSLRLNDFFRKTNTYTNLSLAGNIIIYPKKKIINTEIIKTTKDDPERIGNIKELINNSYTDWDFNNFQGYESITIPFILECKNNNIGDGYTYKGVMIYFLTQNINDLECINGIKYENLKKSAVFFSKGINAIEKKNYKKAISFFEQSYLLDQTKIDNLYNIAAVYTIENNINRACETLKRLKDLGQIQGKKMYEEKCNKH